MQCSKEGFKMIKRNDIKKALSNYKSSATKSNGIKLVRAMRNNIEVINGITVEDLYNNKAAFSKLVQLAQKV